MPGVWMVVPNGGEGRPGAKDHRSGRGASEAERRIVAVPYRARAFVKVQDGCDFRCAYCVIPSVRGKSVSVAAERARRRA